MLKKKIDQSMADVTPEAFPARSNATAGSIGDVPTHVTTTWFNDKIVVTVVQDGRLPMWVCTTPHNSLPPKHIPSSPD
jgi:proteasome assembly chaperone 3